MRCPACGARCDGTVCECDESCPSLRGPATLLGVPLLPAVERDEEREEGQGDDGDGQPPRPPGQVQDGGAAHSGDAYP